MTDEVMACAQLLLERSFQRNSRLNYDEMDSMRAQTTAFDCKRWDVCLEKIAPGLHQGVCKVATERIDWKNPGFCVSVFHTSEITRTASLS